MDTVRYLVDPFVLHQSRRTGQVGALLVRVVEFALSSKEPLACHLGHRLDDVRSVDAPILEKTV